MTAPALLFIELACILVACRAVGWLAARVGQPRVIAEMVTGFLLGPSFFGWLSPSLSGLLFPAASLPTLSLLSQLGLVLYMFTVGMEFRTDLVTRAGHRAIGLSFAGIAGPMVLGVFLTLVMVDLGGFFTAQVSTVQAALFLGTALSITAFPVLARILSERGVLGTALGSLALSAGAMDDAVAWMLLAGVLGSLTGHVSPAVMAVGGGLGYAVVVLGLLRPLWRRFAAAAAERERVAATLLTSVLSCLMLGAWFTEVIGIHPAFGAFVLGVAMPRGVLTRDLRRQIEPVAATLLVPLFFAYAGLHTQLGLLSSSALWGVAILTLTVAIVGKALPCYMGAVLTGATRREALAVATLMNARGMVELILIDIGLSRGVITPTLYTIMVIVALVTTLMTGPIFRRIWVESAAGEPVAHPSLSTAGLS